MQGSEFSTLKSNIRRNFSSPNPFSLFSQLSPFFRALSMRTPLWTSRLLSWKRFCFPLEGKRKFTSGTTEPRQIAVTAWRPWRGAILIKMFKLVENGGRGGEKEREEVREEGLEEEASSSQQSVPISVFQTDMWDLQEKRQLEQRGPGRQHGTSLPLLSDGALQHLPLVGTSTTRCSQEFCRADPTGRADIRQLGAAWTLW